MPIIKSAKKALRQSIRKKAVNLKHKNAVKNAVKNFKKAVLSKNKEDAQKFLTFVYKQYDKAVKTKVVKKNNASRHKSSLTKALNSIK